MPMTPEALEDNLEQINRDPMIAMFFKDAKDDLTVLLKSVKKIRVMSLDLEPFLIKNDMSKADYIVLGKWIEGVKKDPHIQAIFESERQKISQTRLVEMKRAEAEKEHLNLATEEAAKAERIKAQKEKEKEEKEKIEREQKAAAQKFDPLEIEVTADFNIGPRVGRRQTLYPPKSDKEKFQDALQLLDKRVREMQAEYHKGEGKEESLKDKLLNLPRKIKHKISPDHKVDIARLIDSFARVDHESSNLKTRFEAKVDLLITKFAAQLAEHEKGYKAYVKANAAKHKLIELAGEPKEDFIEHLNFYKSGHDYSRMLAVVLSEIAKKYPELLEEDRMEIIKNFNIENVKDLNLFSSQTRLDAALQNPKKHS